MFICREISKAIKIISESLGGRMDSRGLEQWSLIGLKKDYGNAIGMIMAITETNNLSCLVDNG